MKNLLKPLTLALATTAFATTALASDVREFEVTYSSGQATNYFPTMQLSQIQDGSATVKYDYHGANPGWTLDSLLLDFGTSGSIKVSDFTNTSSYGEPVYRALVEDVWVYREVLVEVRLQLQEPYHSAEVRLLVPDFMHRSTPLEFVEGPALFEGTIDLEETTESQTVDSAVVTVDGKEVQLKLQDRIDPVNPEFVIETLWMGHGEKDIKISLDYYSPETTPIAIELIPYPTPEGEEYDLQIKYESYPGQTDVTPMQPLQMLLDQAYGTFY